MKLSVIIPAYNCEKYIVRCIKMIENEIDNQTEIIVIDDGSKDNTLKLCKEYESRNIHIYHQENQGVSMARNNGIDKAKGDYIMFVDADDTLVTGWFKKIQSYLSGEYDIVYFGKNYKQRHMPKEDVVKNIFSVPNDNQTKYLASVCSKLFRKSLIIENHIRFDKQLINGEDLVFALECLLCASDYLFVQAPIYSYFVNYESATHIFKDSFVTSNEYFLHKADSIFSRHNVNEELAHLCVKYSFVTGVVLLLIRISYIDNKNEQNNKLSLFDLPYIKEGKNKYPIHFKEFGWGVGLLYWLINHRLFTQALWLIGLKFKKKSNKKSEFIQI